MTYFSYSEGFKGGGWNSHFNAVLTAEQQAALQRFDQEEAETMEVGSKFDFGSSVRLNLAVFTSDYSNMQLTYRGPAPAGVAPFITNAGKTSIDGAEAELNWLPTEAWRVDASVGYLDATIDRLTNIPLAVLPPGLVEGNFLPYAPEWQGHLGLGYEGRIGGLMVLDGGDGILARVGNLQSRTGAILDAVFDLAGIAILMWGATKFFPAAEAWIMLLFLANVLLFLQNALLGDKVVSYVRGPVVGAVAFPQVLPAALVVCTFTVGFLLVARARRSWAALARGAGIPA
jgi:hypothetical protein